MSAVPVRRDLADVPLEGWDDPVRGRIDWKTLFSGGLTATDTLTCGVAFLSEGGSLAPHRHAEAEVYFGLEGEVSVTIDGAAHRLGPGVALFIPGHAEHGVRADCGHARFFYVFAADSFAAIQYDFGDRPPA